ncbi:MAG: hypothetical protein QG640_4 [Patescibacteria group bacterium]|nr:hypothetical protein [Patescibacteria group bacterium]
MSYKHNPQCYPQFLQKDERLSHLIKRLLIGQLRGLFWCGQGESNSRLVLGKDVFYH